MRISDWSSDVCSSDLHGGHGVHELARARPWRAIDAGSAGNSRRRHCHTSGRERHERGRPKSPQARPERGANKADHFRPTPSGISETFIVLPFGSTTAGTARLPNRSEERRVGQESVSKGRSRGARYNSKKKILLRNSIGRKY